MIRVCSKCNRDWWGLRLKRSKCPVDRAPLSRLKPGTLSGPRLFNLNSTETKSRHSKDRISSNGYNTKEKNTHI